MADIQLQIGATEDVSEAARRAAAGLDGLERGLGTTENAARRTTAATDRLVKAEDSLSSAVTGVNQALEIGTKVYDVASRAVAALAGYVQKGASESIAAEKAQRQLYAALGAGTERITAMTAAIQRRTGADADAMNQQAATLASMGLTTEQIERAIPALRAYSEVTGKDASRAVQALGAAFEEGKVEQKIEQLSRFIPAAEAAADTFGGTVERLTRNLGELQEEIGSSVSESERLKATLGVLDQTVLDLTGRVEGIGPLIGDGLALGLEQSARAAALAAEGLREMLAPTTAISAAATALLPNLGTMRTTLGLLAPEKTTAAAAGLDTLASGLGNVADSMARAAAAVDEGQTDIDATLAKWRAKVAANEEAEENKRKTAREKAAKDRAKAAADEAKEEAQRRADILRIDAENEYNIREGVSASLDALAEKNRKDAEKRDEEIAKRVRKWWGEEEKRTAARAKEAEDAAKAASNAAKQSQQDVLDTIGNVGAYASAGSSAMQAFAAGMAAESTSDRVKGILAGVLPVVGGVIGGLVAGPAGILPGAGVGGAVGGFVSSLPFRDGGAVRGYEIPKARGGAMVIGSGMDSDGRLIEAHSGEVVLSREGVARAGGMQAAARLNDPNAPAPVNRGGHTTINVVALDPMTAVGVIERSVEPAQTQRLRARAGAQYRKELQRAARGARSGGSL